MKGKRLNLQKNSESSGKCFDIQRAYQANKERHDGLLPMESFKTQYSSLKNDTKGAKLKSKGQEMVRKPKEMQNSKTGTQRKANDKFYNRLFEELHSPDTRERFFSQNFIRESERKTEKSSRIIDEFNNYLSEKTEEKNSKGKVQKEKNKQEARKEIQERTERLFGRERSTRSPEINEVSKKLTRSIDSLREWGNYLQHKHEMMRQVKLQANPMNPVFV